MTSESKPISPLSNADQQQPSEIVKHNSVLRHSNQPNKESSLLLSLHRITRNVCDVPLQPLQTTTKTTSRQENPISKLEDDSLNNLNVTNQAESNDNDISDKTNNNEILFSTKSNNSLGNNDEHQELLDRIKQLETELNKGKKQQLTALQDVQKFELEFLELVRQLDLEKLAKNNAIRECEQEKIKVENYKKIIEELSSTNEKLRTQERQNCKLISNMKLVQQCLVESEIKRQSTENALEESFKKILELENRQLFKQQEFSNKLSEKEDKIKKQKQKFEEEQVKLKTAIITIEKLQFQFDQTTQEFKMIKENQKENKNFIKTLKQTNQCLKSQLEEYIKSEAEHKKEFTTLEQIVLSLKEQLKNETKEKLEAQKANHIAERLALLLTSELEDEKQIFQQEKIIWNHTNDKLTICEARVKMLEDTLSKEKSQLKITEHQLSELLNAKKTLEKELMKFKSYTIVRKTSRTVRNKVRPKSPNNSLISLESQQEEFKY